MHSAQYVVSPMPGVLLLHRLVIDEFAPKELIKEAVDALEGLVEHAAEEDKAGAASVLDRFRAIL